MFGKIKGKLGNIFKKNEEHIEENADEVVEEDITKQQVSKNGEEENNLEEKKGFLGGLFSKNKKEEELKDLDEIKEENADDVEKVENEEDILAESIQDAVLEGVSDKEKNEIKSGKELTPKEITEHKKEVEVAIKKEEKLEKETNTDIQKGEKDEVENALESQEKSEIPKPQEIEIPKVEDTLPELPPLEESKEVEVDEKIPKQEEEIPKQGFLGRMFGGKNKEDGEESKSEEETLPEPPKVEDNLPELPSLEESTVEESTIQEESSGGFFSKAFNVVKKKKITDEDYDKIWLDLEIFLLEINVAYEIVEKINTSLKKTLIGNSYDRFGLSKIVREVMVNEVEVVLKEREGSFLEEVKSHKKTNEPLRIMVLGVNGTGKTTSIGKIIKYLQNNNLSVVVAAADTFRAAAVDQIAKHCENLGVKCIRHQNGGDPAAVAFDAVEHAKAKGIDVVLIDTAGRMPNNSNLMLELQKIKRVSKSQMALFIGDSISGNDLIDQISLFDKGVEINGVALTKVDTDERPGSIVTTAYSIEKPIYFLGIGQGYDDLVEFNAKVVAEKLFEVEEE